jgi:hypothetical protein
MNIVLDPSDYNIDNIFFFESVKNTVMNDSSFVRIIFSNKDISLTGIYIKIIINKEVNHITTSSSTENQINNNIIIFIENLEKDILNKYNFDKVKSYKIKDQVIYLINKLISTNVLTSQYILKISGIWETQTIIGLTYKFIYMNDINGATNIS